MFSHLCTEEQGVGHDDVIKDYDVIIVTSELVIPSWIPFPTIIYEPILVPFILTWSLRDTDTHTHTQTDRQTDRLAHTHKHYENITSTAYAGGKNTISYHPMFARDKS